MSITLFSVVAVILLVLSLGEIVARWLFGDEGEPKG